MDLNFSAEELAFRDEVRAFLEEKLPKEISDKVRLGEELTKEDMVRWHAILNERGWLAPNWPAEYGGCEWDAVQKHKRVDRPQSEQNQRIAHKPIPDPARPCPFAILAHRQRRNIPGPPAIQVARGRVVRGM